MKGESRAPDEEKSMSTVTVPAEVCRTLEACLLVMTETMVRGDQLGVARFYADNALLTDLRKFRVEGRAAIDRHWAQLPVYKDWQLKVLETGGDADTPHQRLLSTARMDIKGKEYVDEGYCFVVWKKQPDGVYKIHADIYSPIKFEPQ